MSLCSVFKVEVMAVTSVLRIKNSQWMFRFIKLATFINLFVTNLFLIGFITQEGVHDYVQWRIQNFPEEEVSTAKVGAQTYYCG